MWFHGRSWEWKERVKWGRGEERTACCLERGGWEWRSGERGVLGRGVVERGGGVVEWGGREWGGGGKGRETQGKGCRPCFTS